VVYSSVTDGTFEYPSGVVAPWPVLKGLADMAQVAPLLRDAVRLLGADRDPRAPTPADIPPMPVEY
jgi:hypothetical protein